MGFESVLGFKIDMKKIAALVIVVVALVAAALLPFGRNPDTGDKLSVADTIQIEQFERGAESYEEDISEGDVEPVLTQEVHVTADGFDPQFALVKYDSSQAALRIVNTDSRTRTIVLGQADIREMPPGYKFTVAFGLPEDLEIWDYEDPGTRGKIYVRPAE